MRDAPNTVPTGYRSVLTLDGVTPDPSLLSLGGMLLVVAVVLLLASRQGQHPLFPRLALLIAVLGTVALIAAVLLP